MATLISQNAVSKHKTEKPKRKASPSPVDAIQETENLKVSDSKPKKKKRERKENKEAETAQELEMKKLENTLFGSLHPLNFQTNTEENEEEIDDSALFFTDCSANSELSVYKEEKELVRTDNTHNSNERKPAWVDEEEEKVNINISKVNRLRKMRKHEDETVISGSEYIARLRAQHMKLNPNTAWARLDSRDKNDSSDSDGDEENGDVDNIFQTSEDLVVKGKAKLLPGLLEYARLVDANAQDPSNGPINSVQFHRNGQLLLTGGLDKKLRFFQIDGKRNTKIQTVFVEDCPIRKAAFTPDGSQVILSGRRKFFYSFDLVKAKTDKISLVGRDEKSLETFELSPDSKTIAFIGNEGYILLVSTKTKELIGTLKMNGTSRALTFTNNGQHLLSTGGDGQIYHWDLRTMSCIHKGVDEGCITGTALTCSPTGNIFAAGSDSGIVNVYKRDEFLGGNRKPMKTIENLTTKVDFMKFNHDGQVLAVCSSMKKNSMKLVHVPSFTVFSNWPPANRALQYPRCLDFSPGGGMMAMGNAAGHVLLYKLNHYQHA